MALRPDDPRSPARQIVDELRRMIALGELEPGSQLPSNAEMRTQYSVSNQTAQNAISALKNEGLVYSVPGRGVYVRSDLDQDDLLGQIAGDGEQPELYEDILQQLLKLGEAQTDFADALNEIKRRVAAVEERVGEPLPQSDRSSSMSDS